MYREKESEREREREKERERERVRESERDGERQRERGRGGSLQTPIFPCLGFGGLPNLCLEVWTPGVLQGDGEDGPLNFECWVLVFQGCS